MTSSNRLLHGGGSVIWPLDDLEESLAPPPVDRVKPSAPDTGDEHADAPEQMATEYWHPVLVGLR